MALRGDAAGGLSLPAKRGPHGAAQALLAEWLPWKGWQPPPAAAKWLARLGPALLGFGVLAAMARLPVDLASIEPFDAYLLDAAGWATLGGSRARTRRSSASKFGISSGRRSESGASTKRVAQCSDDW